MLTPKYCFIYLFSSENGKLLTLQPQCLYLLQEFGHKLTLLCQIRTTAGVPVTSRCQNQAYKITLDIGGIIEK